MAKKDLQLVPGPPKDLTKKKRPTRSQQTLQKYLEQASIPILPDVKQTTSPRSLARGSFQRKLLSIFAPRMGEELLNGIRRAIASNDPAAMRLAADILNFTQKGKGVTVNVEQRNESRTANINATTDPGDLVSFEEITRLIAAKRQERLADPQAVDVGFIETPEE